MTDTPLVSAVIPTRKRPDLVLNAVRSVLQQSYRNIEVIVVIDGPDLSTVEALAHLSDKRVRVIGLPTNQGGSHARNVGVTAAQGDWIAFLDDDDEWLPQKIQVQLDIAQRSRYSLPIISSRFVARTPEAEYIWPRRVISPEENVSEYLFSRKSLFQGEGLMVTPTLLARKELLVQLPLIAGMKKHQDWDWVLRAAHHDGVGFEFSEEPLALVRMGSAHEGVSNSDDWRFSLSWIKNRREYVSPQAYAAFILTVVADQASRHATFFEYLTLPFESFRHGRPKLLHLSLYAGMRMFPRNVRHQMRLWFKALV
jgi:glycosyltransferase involved in cell wall biosynthesis